MKLGRVTEIFGVQHNPVVERKLYIRDAEKLGAILDGWVLKWPSGRQVLCQFDYAQEIITEPMQGDLFGAT